MQHNGRLPNASPLNNLRRRAGITAARLTRRSPQQARAREQARGAWI